MVPVLRAAGRPMVVQLPKIRDAAGSHAACLVVCPSCGRYEIDQALTPEGVRKVDAWTGRYGLARAEYAADTSTKRDANGSGGGGPAT